MGQGWLLYPENYTKEQLEKNCDAAFTAAYAARADYAAGWAEYWINEYFNETGENRQDYIDAIHKENNNE